MKLSTFIRRYTLACYFCIAFLFSWGSGAVLLLPKLIQGKPVPAMDTLTLFPILVLGVGMTGVLLSAIIGGRSGIRSLFKRMDPRALDGRWYWVLLIPPVLILLVLLSFKTLVSPAFTPHFFPLGFAFGLVPGLLEEIGWIGFAFPRMLSRRTPLAAGVLLGVLWGLWHLPVVDYLGGAAPHGTYWLPFFLAFIALVAAIRVLIAWVYVNTGSLLLAQLLHASSTGFLVILSPGGISPAQETTWYAVYALSLWIGVVIIAILYGTGLRRSSEQPNESRVIGRSLNS